MLYIVIMQSVLYGHCDWLIKYFVLDTVNDYYDQNQIKDIAKGGKPLGV